MGTMPVRVTSLDEGHFTTLLSDGLHASVSDEPAGLGGLGLGPDPYDLLLMALGSCTAMTLRLYAKRKGLALDRVDVELTHGRVHVDDCKNCESREVFAEQIERKIRLRGELSLDQRAELMGIADRCPVHQTLTKSIRIRSEEVKPT